MTSYDPFSICSALAPRGVSFQEFSFADAYDPISFTGARLSDARVWSFFSSVALDPSFEKSYEKHLGLRSRACRAQLEVLREKLKTVSQAIVPCNSGRPRRAASRMLSRIGSGITVTTCLAMIRSSSTAGTCWDRTSPLPRACRSASP